MLRQRLIDALQALILRIDTTVLPHDKNIYQPLPWLGLVDNTKRSAAGTVARMRAIEDCLARSGPREGVALDVGCSVGYFALRLAELGYFSYGVDDNAQFVRIARAAARRADCRRFVAIEASVDEQLARCLPTADVTLCLSLWHHLVRLHGLPRATAILAELWRKTRQVLFFDCGEAAMPDAYGLAFLRGDPRGWITQYLQETLPSARVERLGRFPAFAAGSTHTPSDQARDLFAAYRAV